MRRLLASSKFQACVAGILSCVLVVFFGIPEDNADQYVGLLLKLITGLAATYAVTAAAEDVASKIGRGGPKAFALLFLASSLLIPNVACSTFDPGGQTRQGMNQQFRFGWDTNSNFTSEGDGSQTGEFTMAEGNLVLAADGTIDHEQSTLTSYLTYKPKADNAERALAHSYEQSSLQMQMQLQYLSLLTQVIGARMGVSVGADGSFAPPVQTSSPSALDRLAELLEQRAAARASPKPKGK